MNVRLVHRLTLTAAAVFVSVLPAWMTGLPSGRLLSSDAEWYVTLAAKIADPMLLTADRGFAYATDVKPGFENLLHWIVIGTASFTGGDLGSASVVLSALSLIAFVLLLYWVVTSAFDDDTLAFVVSLLLVIPIHAMAATTVGFSPLGFLPRDFALTVAVAVLGWYFQAQYRGRNVVALFLVCGCLANFYTLLFAHLVAVLWVAEVIREPRTWRRHVLAAALFAAGAAPVIVTSLLYLRAASPVDVDIMRMRQPYLSIFPLGSALATNLRRVVIYAALTPVLYVLLRRQGLLAARMQPWARVAAASFLVAVAGVVIENTTTLWPYHMSRASLFFLLSATVLCAQALCTLATDMGGRLGRAVGLAITVVLLLVQSNLPSVYRNLRHLADSRDERQELIDVADWLRTTTPPDAVVLAPSSENQDLALTLRAYSLRPMFASYKDGGVSLTDGAKARDWLARMQAQTRVLASSDSEALAAFMRTEHITYAVLAMDQQTARAGVTIAHRAGRFVVVRVL